MSWLRQELQQIRDWLICQHEEHIHHRFNELKELIMASKQDVLDAIAGYNNDVTTDFGNIATAIQALKDQIASGGSVEASDLDDVLTQVNAGRAAAAAGAAAILNPPTEPATPAAPPAAQ